MQSLNPNHSTILFPEKSSSITKSDISVACEYNWVFRHEISHWSRIQKVKISSKSACMQSSSEGGGGWRRPIEQSSQHFVNLPEDISRVRLHNSQHLISIILYTACWRSKSATCKDENVQTQSKRTVFHLWLPSTKIKIKIRRPRVSQAGLWHLIPCVYIV